MQVKEGWAEVTGPQSEKKTMRSGFIQTWKLLWKASVG